MLRTEYSEVMKHQHVWISVSAKQVNGSLVHGQYISNDA